MFPDSSLTNLIARLGAFGAVFQRDYSPLLACASMAWAAVHMPLIVVCMVRADPGIGRSRSHRISLFRCPDVFRGTNSIRNRKPSCGGLSLPVDRPLAAAVVFWGR